MGILITGHYLRGFMTQFKSAFTIDVECGISITMRDSYGIGIPPTERVVINTSKILELLETNETKATFFILGIVAEHYPDLIKNISEQGHELGVHGYHHLEFSKITPKKAFQEIDSAKKLIEDISGKQVYGHRAPAFSINEETKWGLDIVAQAGFLYDSSIMPIQSGRYGWPEFSKEITEISTKEERPLIEVPISTAKFFNWEIPACGGRYLQILPYKFTRNALIKISKEKPAIVYMHPYEVDEESYPEFYHEQLRAAGFTKRIETYLKWLNRGSFFSKIERLTNEFEFRPMIDIINEFQNKSREH